jgi:4-amino-4-deoxy-L-arabinose transferase-like glycosyltransferase
LREKTVVGSPAFFFACWGVFPVLFFSLSQSKLPGYILPAIPPFALVLAITWARVVDGDSGFFRSITVALGLTWMAIGLSSAFWMRRLPPGARELAGRTIYFCAALAIAVGIAIALLGVLRRRGAVLISALVVAVLVEIAGARVLPVLDPYLSSRPHAELLRQDRRPDRLFTYRLARSWDWGLAFYLERELPEWNPGDPDAALVLTTAKGLQELRRSGRFRGEMDEDYKGILYVPLLPASR